MYFVKGDISINLSQQAQEVHKSVRNIIINNEHTTTTQEKADGNYL